ncbi:hypothetical protein [Thermincola potens]|uniref:Uncharacterized protein n=1 Tax=Thermincola potens (strain JR) TaxID=635013 RepID=D5XCC8_THEPJ|nr:hypothetical protein [Thermincola potens]ADG83580.1 hypothetical protein TherJR_2747 [Thermincola potens JR]
MRRIVSLISVLLLLLTSLSGLAFAEEKSNLTKNNIKHYIERANKGDQEAVKELKKLKAFNKDEVRKVADQLTVNFTDGEKSIEFEDGSAIVIGAGKATSSEVTSQAVTVEDWYVYYSVKALGIEVGRYTIWYSYDVPTETYVKLTDHYDTASDIIGVDVTAKGTSAVKSSGTYVKVRGTAEVSTWAGKYSVIGNAYGYPNPLENYASWVIN